MVFKNKERVVNLITIGAVIYLLVFAFSMALFPIRPFWNDEWRLSYNIKFKTLPELWGRLDLLQQCPRTYLSMLKLIAQTFDYSYTSLRLPPLIVSCFSLLLCFKLKKRIFPKDSIYGNLFILIFISSQTFTDYLVQVKHYEADLFLCLLALWQLITLLDVSNNGVKNNRMTYFLLCLSLMVAPFFGYIYPIAICPVFIVLFIKVLVPGQDDRIRPGIGHLFLVGLPLVLAIISILAFYMVDVKQLMADNKMYESYYKMLGNVENKRNYFADFWYFFALVGSGLLFEIIFGILGILVFAYSLYRLFKTRFATYCQDDYLKLYSVLLIIVTLGLVFMGKILGGVARLTSFTLPAISLLITWVLIDLRSVFHKAKIAYGITALLFVGMIGNIVSLCINVFTASDYSWRIHTLWTTSKAIELARAHKIPIMMTQGIRAEHVEGLEAIPGPVPGRIRTHTIDKEQIDGAEFVCPEVILKINPSYKVWDTIPVYQMPDMKWSKEYVQQLPDTYNEAVICDGLTYRIVRK